MTRFIPALLALLLASCSSQPAGAPITVEHLSNVLDSQWPGFVPKVWLSDNRYELVNESVVIRAALDARRVWREEVWDCDDQVSSTLHRLRLVRHHDAALPPAVGRLRAFVAGGVAHDVVWWLDADTGRLRFYDCTYFFEADVTAFKPIMLTDL
jgi:hypothetical protein